ncbi:MAG: hypothetical protein NG747_16510, partial [Candidatus Brocadia sp.]|nr:hypothetical protein [Candidatus Brocadia sp.]
MKRSIHPSMFFIFLVTQFFFFNSIKSASTASAEDWSSWKNIYTVGWRDAVKGNKANAHANLQKKITYARHMGYDSIAFGCADVVSYIQSYSDKSNLKFYIVDPHLLWEHFDGIVPGYVIDEATSYTQAQKDWYTLNMVNKSTDAFPNNLVPSYYFGTSKKYSVVWDFQQQRVIDMVVEKIVDVVKSLEDRSLNFIFGGYIVDVARLRGAFAYWNGTKNVPIYLDYWTGINSGVIHGTITHEYPIVDDGMAAYYKTLNNRLSAEFGEQVKWIIMPSHIYDASGNQNIDEWLYEVEQRSDYAELQPDLYLVENHELKSFLTEPNIFNSIIPIAKDMVGSAHNTQAAEDTNRSLAANIGINGAWYHWAPMFGAAGNMPDFQSITEVWPRLKLIRCIPNWDNLNNVPLSDRSWNNTTGVYQSTK